MPEVVSVEEADKFAELTYQLFNPFAPETLQLICGVVESFL